MHSASRSGSVSPTISAASIARPLAPRMSVTTRVSFTLASSSGRHVSRPAAGDRRTSGRASPPPARGQVFAAPETCQLTVTFPDRLPGTAGWVGRHQRRQTRVGPRRRQPTLGRLPEDEAPSPLAGVQRPDGNCPARNIRPDRRRYRLRGDNPARVDAGLDHRHGARCRTSDRSRRGPCTHRELSRRRAARCRERTEESAGRPTAGATGTGRVLPLELQAIPVLAYHQPYATISVPGFGETDEAHGPLTAARNPAAPNNY